MGGVIGTLEGRWAVVDGVLMYARVSVDTVPPAATPVVLVHGLAVSSQYLVPTAERLAPNFPVFVPDLPGYGKSANPRRVLGVPGLADALAGWMGTVGIGRAHLIGNSLGCQTIVELAVRYPELVESAVLVGPTMDPSGGSIVQQGFRLGLDILREPPSAWIVQGYDYWMFGLRRTLVTLHYALNDPIREKLPRVGVPMLVVRGEHDAIVSQSWAEEVARLLPIGRLEVVPGAAHIVNFNAAPRLVRLFRAFVGERS